MDGIGGFQTDDMNQLMFSGTNAVLEILVHFICDTRWDGSKALKASISMLSTSELKSASLHFHEVVQFSTVLIPLSFTVKQLERNQNI